MFLSVLFLVVGIAMLIGGGDLLVRGASGLARSFGVSELVIGLTVVAFGTSAPELSVNILAAVTNQGDISFGNIIGSNIANIGLILGIVALIKPLQIHGTVIRREIPMMILACAATFICALDGAFRGTVDQIDRGEGLILLMLFCVFLHYTVSDVLKQYKSDDFVLESQSYSEDLTRANPTARNRFISIGLTLIGLVILIAGGKFTVNGASDIALALKIPPVIVGLTVVALGTSLPELVTSVIAVRRGQSDLAVGNVVGSNIFNLLWILGLTGVIRPVPVPAGGIFDLIWMSIFSVVLIPMSLTNQRRITRLEGGILLTGYLGYVVWRALSLHSALITAG